MTDVNNTVQSEQEEREKRFFVRNKDLLREIQASKMTYCSYVDEKYKQYDGITMNPSEIDDEFLLKAKQNRLNRLNNEIKEKLKAKKAKPSEVKAALLTIDDINDEDVVIRIMESGHVPLDPNRKRRGNTENSKHKRTNFLPFKQYIYKDGVKTEVLRSHWIGDFETGHFSDTHGNITDNLADMFHLIVNRYAMRRNWRGYCVDDATEVLTDSGWKNQSDLTIDDKVLSYNKGKMVWSNLKSIFRNEYVGDVHMMTGSINAITTPKHKFISEKGLMPIEQFGKDSSFVIGGGHVESENIGGLSNAIVILNLLSHLYSNGKEAVLEKSIVEALEAKYSLSSFVKIKHHAPNSTLNLSKFKTEDIIEMYNRLTNNQIVLLDSLIKSLIIDETDNSMYPSHEKINDDNVMLIMGLLGYAVEVKLLVKPFGSDVNVKSIRANKEIKRDRVKFRSLKDDSPEATQAYAGLVWCPETEYGSFFAKRDNVSYLTGNTYVDEMQNHSITHLTQEGLQFNEAVSDIPNPFAFYTVVMERCFTRVFNLEKNNQNIRDELIMASGNMPSFTKQVDQEYDRYNVKEPAELKIIYRVNDDGTVEGDNPYKDLEE